MAILLFDPLKASVSPIDPVVTLKPILGETVDAPTQGMRQAMEFAVPVNDEQIEELRLSNSQSVSPDYTSQIVSHFLRKLYTDMLQEEFPERLKPLIEELDAQEQASRSRARR